eukprot:77163_1
MITRMKTISKFAGTQRLRECVLFFHIAFCIEFTISNAQNWISPSSTLHNADLLMAVGSYNDSIFILGGWNNHYQITEWVDQVFISSANVRLTDASYGGGQWYTQQSNTLYMIEPSGNAFSIFTMDTQQFVASWNGIRFEGPNVGDESCLASSVNYLFVSGGDVGLTAVQMFDLHASQWIENVTPMQQARAYHSCIIDEVNEELYVIGGHDGSYEAYRKTIEKITVSNIQQNAWAYIEDLTEGTIGTRAVIYEDNIYVIGGLTKSAQVLMDIHVISTSSGTVTVSRTSLPYGQFGAAIILVDAVIYLFGGRRCSPCQEMQQDTDKWAYLRLDVFHFVCHYNGDHNAHLTLNQYSDIMVNASLVSFENIVHSGWKQAGITFFDICNVFGTHLDNHCPTYSADESDHVAVGILGIAVDYKRQILDVMNGVQFRNQFTDNMNIALRHWDESDNFEAIEMLELQAVTEQ